MAWAYHNWFFIAFSALLAGAYGITRLNEFVSSGGEAAVLADLCILVPLLYFWCYRRRLPTHHLIMRSVALACLGLWLASLLIPAADQAILPHFSWARTLGILGLALVELYILIVLMKLLFSGKASPEEISRRSGAPPFVARLMMMEARFWSWLWRLICPPAR